MSEGSFLRYMCKEETFNKFTFQCATGFSPQYQSGSNLNTDFFQPAQTDKNNPFAPVGNIGWTYKQIKRTSRMGHPAEFDESDYSKRPGCSEFHDEGFALVSKLTSEGTDWLSLRMPETAVKRLEGASHMHVYVCAGERDEGFSKHGLLSILFGVNGKVWGSGFLNQAVPKFKNCIRVTNPNPVEVLKPGEFFALRFQDFQKVQNQDIVVGSIFLVGDQGEVTPIPSVLAVAPPTKTRSPSQGITASPSLLVSGEGEEEDDFSPTTVPHEGDDQPGRRRRRRRRLAVSFDPLKPYDSKVLRLKF